MNLRSTNIYIYALTCSACPCQLSTRHCHQEGQPPGSAHSLSLFRSAPHWFRKRLLRTCHIMRRPLRGLKSSIIRGLCAALYTEQRVWCWAPNLASFLTSLDHHAVLCCMVTCMTIMIWHTFSLIQYSKTANCRMLLVTTKCVALLTLKALLSIIYTLPLLLCSSLEGRHGGHASGFSHGILIMMSITGKSRHKYHFCHFQKCVCHDKRCVLSRQTRVLSRQAYTQNVCHDKNDACGSSRQW